MSTIKLNLNPSLVLTPV